MTASKFKILIFLAFLWLCVSPASGADLDAEAILVRSLEATKNATISAVYSENYTDYTLLQRKNDDGTVFSRREPRYERGVIHIANAEGTHNVYPDIRKILTTDFVDEEIPGLEDFTSYELKQGSLWGQECYIITRRLTDDPGLYAAFEAYLPEASELRSAPDQLREAALQTLPMTELFYIAPDTLFLLADERYNFSGRLMRKISFSNIDFAPNIPDSAFSLPVGYALVRAADPYEFRAQAEILREESRTKVHGPPIGLGDFRPPRFSAAEAFAYVNSVRGLPTIIITYFAITFGAGITIFVVVRNRARREKM